MAHRVVGRLHPPRKQADDANPSTKRLSESAAQTVYLLIIEAQVRQVHTHNMRHGCHTQSITLTTQVQLLLFESFGGFGKGVREILWDAANVLQNKLTRAQYLDEVTWTTKSWLGLQKQRISVVLRPSASQSRL